MVVMFIKSIIFAAICCAGFVSATSISTPKPVAKIAPVAAPAVVEPLVVSVFLDHTIQLK